MSPLLFRGAAARVWFRSRPTDLRLGFRGLAGLVQTEFHRNPRSGDLFVFVNRRRNAIRILFADSTGLCLFAKKPSSGCFKDLFGASGSTSSPLELTSAELMLFLETVEAKSRRKRRQRTRKRRATSDSQC
jgi:transposase